MSEKGKTIYQRLLTWPIALFAVMGVSLGPRAIAGEMAGQPVSPNIVFLAVDDMRDWVNCLGGYQGTVHTPNID